MIKLKTKLAARVVVGIVLFVGLPGVTLLAANGVWWGFFIAPGTVVMLVVTTILGVTTEWIFGVSPADYAGQERGNDYEA